MTAAPVLPDLGPSFEVTANITKIDIAEGVKSDCAKCPAARAFLRKLKKLGFDWAYVGQNLVVGGVGREEDGNPEYRSRWGCSEDLLAFTNGFDTKGPRGVSPTKITVTLFRQGRRAE